MTDLFKTMHEVQKLGGKNENSQAVGEVGGQQIQSRQKTKFLPLKQKLVEFTAKG